MLRSPPEKQQRNPVGKLLCVCVCLPSRPQMKLVWEIWSQRNCSLDREGEGEKPEMN